MTTAIIGVGKIGGAVARDLVAGGESVVLAAKDKANADALADELGPLARAASVEDGIADGDAVVFAVWLDTIKALIPQNAPLLEGKVVVDPSNPIEAPGGDLHQFGLNGELVGLDQARAAVAGEGSHER